MREARNRWSILANHNKNAPTNLPQFRAVLKHCQIQQEQDGRHHLQNPGTILGRLEKNAGPEVSGSVSQTQNHLGKVRRNSQVIGNKLEAKRYTDAVESIDSFIFRF